MADLTIEDAKRAKECSKSNGANYGLPLGKQESIGEETSAVHQCQQDHGHPFPEIVEDFGSEPHDPEDVDHVARQRTRIAPGDRDPHSLPTPLLECGCGDCPDRVDPLADEIDGAFADVLERADYMAGDEDDGCPNPRPMTVQRAATAYLRYQLAAVDRDGWNSCLGETRAVHGRYMDAERRLLDQWEGEVTTALLSLRLSPVETIESDTAEPDDRDSDAAYYGIPVGKSSNSRRRWVPSLRLDERLRDNWRKVYDRLRYHLSDYQWGYCWVVATTDSATTPHLHVHLWIRDSDDEISVDHLRPAVEAYAQHTTGADPEKHPVEAGESDAAVIRHDPSILSVSEEQALYVNRKTSVESGFRPNTTGFAYLMHQRPHWVLSRLHNDESTVDDEQTALEGATIAWASPNDWIGSGGAFNPR